MRRCNFLYHIGIGSILLCCFLGSCSKDDKPELLPTDLFSVSESVIIVGATGENYKLVVRSESGWTISGETSWCKVDKNRGVSTDTVVVAVVENLFREERNCELTVRDQSGEQNIVAVRQGGASKDYLYRLPVIFHVLYTDAADINQNIHKNYLEGLLPVCNALYRQGYNGLDMGVEFYPATQDPSGKVLAEPGIERIQWTKENVSVYDFIQSSAPEDVALIWDPNRYVNVVIFPFRELSGLAAISTMPFTVSSGGLKGLQAGDAYFERSLNEVYCLAFNTQYVIRPNAGVTLAHELGHYLGLFHVFSDGSELETDYCSDTPNYNRSAYLQEAKRIIATEGVESPRLYERTDDAGKVFISRNIMDYEYTYQDEFTEEQYKRIRHVLENSPLIPGIKKNNRKSNTKCGEDLPRPLIAGWK